MLRKNLFHIWFFVGFVIVALFFFSATLFLENETEGSVKQVTRQQRQIMQQNFAGEIGRDIYNKMKKIENYLKILAKNKIIIEGGDDCSSFLKQIDKELSLPINNIGRVGLDGFFNCAVIDSTLGVDGNKYAYIHNLLTDPEHKRVISRLVDFGYQDKNVHIFAIHVPVYDENGEFAGSLGGAIYLSDLNEEIESNMNRSEGMLATLIDDNGQIIYHQDPGLIGVNIYTDDDIADAYKQNYGLFGFFDDMASGESVSSQYYYQDNEFIGQIIPIYFDDERFWSLAVSDNRESGSNLLKGYFAKVRSQTYIAVAVFVILLLMGIVLIYLWNRALKQEVTRRTEYLNKKNTQLRKTEKKLISLMNKITDLNKVMIGRELKMFELKKKIKDLKGSVK